MGTAADNFDVQFPCTEISLHGGGGLQGNFLAQGGGRNFFATPRSRLIQSDSDSRNSISAAAENQVGT